MCVGGYASYLSSCYVQRENVNFLFTGYQAIGSVGDKIMNQEHKTVAIQGKSYLMKAQSLGKLDLSGHAGNDELIGLIKSLNQHVLKKVILIHGDDDRKELLKDELEKVLNNDKEIMVPKVGQVIKF